MTNYPENDRTDQESNFPTGFQSLISVAKVETTLDSLSVFLHACALDVGFVPKNFEEQDVYNCMPDGWKTAGAWNFQYWHRSCPELFCSVICIPIYSFVAVHGALDNGSSRNIIHVKLKATDYLNDDAEFEVVDFFKNTKKLERKFKDKFCFPLLAILQESAGCAPTFGFSAAVDEVKMYILQLLPVQSVVAMSLVNKDSNRIANSPYLWQHLLVRDFGLVDDQSVSSDENYKELYKREYIKRKRIVRVVSPPRAGPSFIFPNFPPSYVDVRRDLDPALQQAFPYLRDRFRPNRLFPPYDFPGWFM